jgi:hypothetical protein
MLMDIPREIADNFNYEELPLKSYKVIDARGKKVTIYPKKESKHGLNHPLEKYATVFYNLGDIVKNPTKVEVSTSMNPKARIHRLKGEVLIYSQKDFVTKLAIPGNTDTKGDLTEVVVFYDSEKKENYTLTYHVKA